ncbi:MAG: beta-propeller fold lactonase family protein [Roseiflexaceae bacterium]|nr:beta-propeller fold lactonase family protein [Roseiflexaceae bacterium]
MQFLKKRRIWLFSGVLGYALIALALSISQNVQAAQVNVEPAQRLAAVFGKPTHSSPIALSQNNTLVWVVNPDDDSVSVIRTDTNARIATLANVGDEPQSIALDPNNQFAYVANAAGNSVSVIQITNANPATFVARVEKELVTGAEPWNIVISPDGKRVFVANSAQDTISVIRTDAPNARTVIGSIDLRNSACNGETVAQRQRHFQPRGLAVTVPDGTGNATVLATRFLSFVKPGGVQGDDNGKEGVVCQIGINTNASNLDQVTLKPTKLAAQVTGFKIDANGDGVADDTSAYPNQLQSVVIRGDRAYMPNIAASPSRPIKFNVDTHAYVNMVSGVNSGTLVDAQAINMHLGARLRTDGKQKLFFSNPWAIAFTTQSGNGAAYAVSAGSDLLVKLRVEANGALNFTTSVSETAYVDLNNPDDAATSGANAGKNPLGIVINDAGTLAYTMNYVSRNMSVVDLASDRVVKVVETSDLPDPNSFDEVLQVGKEIFFASRGVFAGPQDTMVSLKNRLSSEGWQNCASCHFAGLTDGVIWQFTSGPRKSIALNGSWNPHNPDDQRVLNYSGINDEVQDFEPNIRNVSGPGNLPTTPPQLDPNHGLLIGNDGNINGVPDPLTTISGVANAGRPQHTVQLPGSDKLVPALDAMSEWVRFAVRTPNRPLTTAELNAGGGSATGGVNAGDVNDGRIVFLQAGCQTCHGGGKWSNSVKDFASPPPPELVEVEADPNGPNEAPNPNGFESVTTVLENNLSFNLGVPGANNPVPGQPEIGAVEKDTANKDALGKDHDGDGKGEGYNPPSLLGIYSVPPYYHNGACETLLCVLENVNHRRSGLRAGQADPLDAAAARAKLVSFLESIDADTAPATNLRLNRHDIFLEPAAAVAGTTVELGANISLFGPRVPTFTPGPLKVTFYDGSPGAPGTSVIGEADLAGVDADFGTTTVKVPWTVPTQLGSRRIFVTVDAADLFKEDNERDNTANRRVHIRPLVADRTAPEVSNVRINDDAAITSAPEAKVTFNAVDPAGAPGEQVSGVKQFSVVRYTYDTWSRRWVEEVSAFRELPVANGDGSFTVDTKLKPREGVAYVQVRVRDDAGRISRAGFDAISFVPGPETNLELVRNDTRVFRVTLNAGQSMRFTFTPSLGDVDVSVFQGISLDAPRIAVSALNGPAAETVTFTAPAGGPTSFQIEVRAAATSRYRLAVADGLGSAQLAADVIAPSKEIATAPIVGDIPPLQTAIDEPTTVFVPLIGQ